MANCCDKNPLQRSGINQAQRLLPALKAAYIQVDEREFADWIFFAEEFSRYLKYYNLANEVAGDWKPFFSNDISAILGSIAVQRVEEYRRAIKQRFDFIRDNDNAGNVPAVKQKLNELFAAVFTLTKALDNYLQKLPVKHPDEEKDFAFRATLVNIVQAKLLPVLKRLLAYYKAIDGSGTTDFRQASDLEGWKILNLQVSSAEDFKLVGVSKAWGMDWNTDYPLIVADDSIYGPSAWTDHKRIVHAANHNLFSSAFDQYLQAYTRTVQEARRALLETLEKWDAHPAHYALFLAFLKLFQVAQTDINTITKRHLDFYYKEVLRLKPKDPQPNRAHILIELAKQTDAYGLGDGTEFKAGKDSEGKEVVYALEEETTFNKARVVSLRSFYKGNPAGKDDIFIPGTTTLETSNKGRLFASSVANSDDGLGAGLKSPNKEWHPYINKKFKDGDLTEVTMPHAQIGFAIASHYLFLNEGERRVSLRFQTSNNALLTGLTVDCFLTTAKAWHAVVAQSFSPGTTKNLQPCAELSIIIHGDAPAIVNYNPAVHGGTLSTDVPVVKVYLRNDDKTLSCRYDEFKTLTLTDVEVEVKVGMETTAYTQTGLKQLLMSNDFGPVDASKPFQPFGPSPAIGNRLVIGNKELFSKKNAIPVMNIEWKGAAEFTSSDLAYLTQPDGASYPNVALRYLEDGIWKTFVQHDEMFSASSSNVDSVKIFPSSLFTIGDKTITDYQSEYSEYTANTSRGFIAIQLTENFGHKKFQDDLTAYLIKLAKDPTTAGDKPTEPYTATIQSLYISYSAHTSLSLGADQQTFDNRGLKFFHLYPFGEVEQHKLISGDFETYLLPQFTHKKQSARVDHVAEFYIGLEQLRAQQSVNILFQVMEGSSDPLVVKPDDHIHWSYLSKNKWHDLEDFEVKDTTRQLVQSGIISFIIPENASITNTLLPANTLWLRASVSEVPEAVCKLITVDAQAAVATFKPNNNAADFLDSALPAGTISKLKIPTSEVKAASQPYASFGGRAKESNENFYTRVSERLRHKGRAITIWDYEHLVLEAFPSLHKVKCLNHTKFEKNIITGEVEYNEVAPGYVTVITIPSLVNRNDANPLRPYTNQNVLLEVEDYLKQRISCHVKLRVKNPRFEEVLLSFKLKLIKGFDDFIFYRTKLQEELTQYLTPWAYRQGSDIEFGGKIRKSTVINFIEERPYVDFITDVKMYHIPNPDHEEAGDCHTTNTSDMSGDLETVEASTGRSILVSVPSTKHQIIKIEEIAATESECAPPPNTGNISGTPVNPVIG